VAVAAALFVTWPQSLGGRVSYLMVSGHSMEPTMHVGDLAVIRGESEYRTGEIVAYRVPKGEVGAGAVVIHRIVSGNGRTGFTTRGDNNRYNDSWHPRAADIIGARWTLIPGAGSTFSQLRGPLPLAAFAALLTMLASYELLRPRRKPDVTPSPSVTNDNALPPSPVPPTSSNYRHGARMPVASTAE